MTNLPPILYTFKKKFMHFGRPVPMKKGSVLVSFPSETVTDRVSGNGVGSAGPSFVIVHSETDDTNDICCTEPKKKTSEEN